MSSTLSLQTLFSSFYQFITHHTHPPVNHHTHPPLLTTLISPHSPHSPPCQSSHSSPITHHTHLPSLTTLIPPSLIALPISLITLHSFCISLNLTSGAGPALRRKRVTGEAKCLKSALQPLNYAVAKLGPGTWHIQYIVCAILNIHSVYCTSICQLQLRRNLTALRSQSLSMRSSLPMEGNKM